MLTNCDNFRDMGGNKTHDGHVLKEKKIIRSGKLSDLNDDDVVFLEKYGLKHDVDFRSMSERKNEPDRIPASVITSHRFFPLTKRGAGTTNGNQGAITTLMSKRHSKICWMPTTILFCRIAPKKRIANFSMFCLQTTKTTNRFCFIVLPERTEQGWVPSIC